MVAIEPGIPVHTPTQLRRSDDGTATVLAWKTETMKGASFWYYPDNRDAIIAVRKHNDLTPCPVCKQIARWHNDDGSCRA